MSVSVRDTLERLGHTVGYDKRNGGVLVKDKSGRDVNIGSDGFTLGEDNRYYAESADKVYGLLSKNGLSAGEGWSAVRNTLSPTESVGYNSKTGQFSVNGKNYNVDSENFVNVDGTIYGKSRSVDSLKRKPYVNDYEELENKILKKLERSQYDGYDPENDENYQNAYSDYVKNAKSDMGARGITSDSLISHYASQGAKKLLPQYAEADYERYKDETDSLRSLLYATKNLDDSARQSYQANETAAYNAAKLEAENRKTVLEEILGDLNMAVQRSDTNGFISEQDAPILGVAAGTPTFKAQDSINKRLFEVSQLKLKNQLELDGYKEKSSIDEAVDNRAASRDEGINNRAAARDAEIDNKAAIRDEEIDNRAAARDESINARAAAAKEEANNRAAQRDHEYDIEMLALSTEAKKEIARIQNDLAISKAEATAYYRMIYK